MTPLEIYWVVAIASSSVLGLMILLNVFGFDVDELDIDFGLGDAFSFNSAIAFVCVAAWSGYIGHTTTQLIGWVILAFSIAAGLAAYIGSIYIMHKMKGMESTGTLNMENGIGTIAEVYLTIPEKESGKGQIQGIIQGRLVTIDAISKGDAIPTGTKVIIYDSEQDVVYVEPYNESEIN